MSNTCKICGSYAINEGSYDRERGVDSDLCDPHYWKKRADIFKVALEELLSICPSGLSCSDFHHGKGDQNHGVVCPPSERYIAAKTKARKLLKP